MEIEVPLKLLLKPDTYPCTWAIPIGDEESLVHGSVDLVAGQPPRGEMSGHVPCEWESSDGSSSASFPQRREYPLLRGRLANGLEITLLEAVVETWMPDQAVVDARAALVGRSPGPEDSEFSSVKLQVTHLDSIAGRGPLGSFSFPKGDGEHLAGKWSVEGNPSSSQEWSNDEAEVGLQFDGSMSLGDPFRFHMSFSPVVVITTASPLRFQDWVSKWINPLRRIVSLATGRPEELTYLSMRLRADEGGASRELQVYGSAISQRPFASSRRDVEKFSSAFTTANDNVSLLELLKAWQEKTEERHPLLETYGAFVGVPSQHPRLTFLLLIQALEGLYGADNKDAIEERRLKHVAQRQEIIANLEALKNSEELTAADYKFLKNNVPKRPQSGLDTGLKYCFSSLPVDLSQKMENDELVQFVKTSEEEDVKSWADALRIARNNLAHGNFGYEASSLRGTVSILDGIARAHLLRILGCSTAVQERVLRENDW